MVHYLMSHMLRQAGSEIHHTLHHQGSPFLRLVFFLCAGQDCQICHKLLSRTQIFFKLCLLRLRTLIQILAQLLTVSNRSAAVSRDGSLLRRFGCLNCSTGCGPEKQSNVSSSPRFLHIIPVSLRLQAAHSHLSLPPPKIHFASLREKQYCGIISQIANMLLNNKGSD